MSPYGTYTMHSPLPPGSYTATCETKEQHADNDYVDPRMRHHAHQDGLHSADAFTRDAEGHTTGNTLNLHRAGDQSADISLLAAHYSLALPTTPTAPRDGLWERTYATVLAAKAAPQRWSIRTNKLNLTPARAARPNVQHNPQGGRGTSSHGKPVLANTAFQERSRQS
jgi:hypothetical protein